MPERVAQHSPLSPTSVKGATAQRAGVTAALCRFDQRLACLTGGSGHLSIGCRISVDVALPAFLHFEDRRETARARACHRCG